MSSRRTARFHVSCAADAPAYWMIGVLWRVFSTGVQTGNQLCLLEQLCSAGSGPTRHDHPQDEGLYVVSGRVAFSAGGTDFVAEAGSLVSVPRRTEHSFVVEREAVLLNFYLPAGFEMFLMGSARPAERDTLPPQDDPPPPLALARRLSDDYSGLPPTEERTTTPNPSAAAIPIITSRAEAETWHHERGCWRILADGASTGGSHCVFEIEAPTGVAVSPRVHRTTDVALYVLDGELEIVVDREVRSLAKGAFAFVPRGSVYALRVTDEASRWLLLHTAAGYERVLRHAGGRSSSPSPQTIDGETMAPDSHLIDLHVDIGLQMIDIPDAFRA